MIVLLAALACAGTWAAGQVRSIRDRSEVAKMTEKMKTICVGRFLVDVPSRAEVSLSREMMDGFDIATVEEDETTFRERVAAREAEITAQGAQGVAADSNGVGSMVEARDLRVPGMIGRLLIYGRTRSYSMEGSRRLDDEWVSVEAHAHLDGMSFSLSMQYADVPDGRTAEALLARLRLRGENEIPSVPGFCIGRAVFTEPLPPHKTEHIAMHVGFLDHPDVALALASLPGGDRDSSLLTRFADMDKEANPDELLRVTKLRFGKRTINGIDGEEVLERIRELNFATTYGFMWETPGVQGDPVHPFLSLELQGGISPRPSGKPVDTSLHEDAVLALWDRISSSIRSRPSGPPPGPAEPPEPAAPRLGTLATAGEPCPQSGWWKCREGGPGVDVQGGSVQWIRKGDRMPQALLLPRQTLLQKLRGLQPSIEPSQPTTWKLLDKRLRPRTPTIVALAPPGPVSVTADTPAGASPVVALGTDVRTGE
ncbi:T6SS immunity protein Tli4 family protein, partial [Massilia sp. Root335]|uniref:T6SS immunity protein Tli4 family protein n=1 Tax=Massilia sp. Root335 TaxID=1736517 RepID=UPI0012F6393A